MTSRKPHIFTRSSPLGHQSPLPYNHHIYFLRCHGPMTYSPNHQLPSGLLLCCSEHPTGDFLKVFVEASVSKFRPTRGECFCVSIDVVNSVEHMLFSNLLREVNEILWIRRGSNLRRISQQTINVCIHAKLASPACWESKSGKYSAPLGCSCMYKPSDTINPYGFIT